MRAPARWATAHTQEELEFTRWVGELVARHGASLSKAAVAEGLEPVEALDAVHDAVVTLMSRPEWRTLSQQTSDGSYLLIALVKNQARNLRRRRHRTDVSMDEVVGPAEVDLEWRQLDERLVEAEQHVRLTGCIDALGAMQRAVVWARLFEGRSGAEVAKHLGLRSGNVAVILHRARHDLRACLAASRARFGLGAQQESSL